MTEQGAIKILDFGLAKASLEPDAEANTVDAALTGPGTTLGTVSYMSPEQLRGGAIDARTDLFSLGLVLYEMATGTRAFQGKMGAEVSAAILHDQPARARSLRPDLPEKLDEVILKTIEKDRRSCSRRSRSLRPVARRSRAGRFAIAPRHCFAQRRLRWRH